MTGGSLGPYILGPTDAPERGIYLGDCRELTPPIPRRSVDLIFTDPPYDKAHLPLYEWIAQVAPRLLKPTGFLLLYTGGYWKDQVMAMMRETMEFWWDYQVAITTGNMVWNRHTIAKTKSLLCYRPQAGSGQPTMAQVLGYWEGGKRDKQWHTWGQQESTQRYYTQAFSKRGAIVLDPMCGGGTAAAIAKLTGRRWLCFDEDPEAIAATRQRLATVEPLPIEEQSSPASLLAPAAEQLALNLSD
jgi:SAM-dependent methyltransferase